MTATIVVVVISVLFVLGTNVWLRVEGEGMAERLMERESRLSVCVVVYYPAAYAYLKGHGSSSAVT